MEHYHRVVKTFAYKLLTLYCLTVKLLLIHTIVGRSGKFFRDGLEDRSSIESYDSDLQKAVWRISCQLVNFRSSLVNDTLDDISLSSMK